MSEKQQANIPSYYDEKFDRLSQRTKDVLNTIKLECEYVEELLTVYEQRNQRHSRKE